MLAGSVESCVDNGIRSGFGPSPDIQLEARNATGRKVGNTCSNSCSQMIDQFGQARIVANERQPFDARIAVPNTGKKRLRIGQIQRLMPFDFISWKPDGFGNRFGCHARPPGRTGNKMGRVQALRGQTLSHQLHITLAAFVQRAVKIGQRRIIPARFGVPNQQQFFHFAILHVRYGRTPAF